MTLKSRDSSHKYLLGGDRKKRENSATDQFHTPQFPIFPSLIPREGLLEVWFNSRLQPKLIPRQDF